MKKMFVVLVGVMALALTGCGGGDGGTEETTDDCAKACENLECGVAKDGCAECGTCSEGKECKDNLCVVEDTDECTAKCEGKVCGEVDGCTCGAGCKDGEQCTAEGICEVISAECADSCKDKECGKVGDCECGTCEEGTTCSAANTCEADECVPVCEDENGPFECGDSGCPDDPCGECPDGDQWACIANKCECTPKCEGKVCGPDACGGDCGTCAAETPNCTMAQDECVAACGAWEFNDVQKVNFMEIGKGGHPGEALDVDGDPDTCAPADDCEGGLNNQLSGLLAQLSQFVDADAELTKTLDEGKLIMIADGKVATDCTEFVLNMFIGDTTAPKEECDFQAAKCDYCYRTESLDVKTCKPLIAFENAKICDGKLSAGGPDQLFQVTVPISDGVLFNVVANMAQLVGDVNGEGDAMKIENGVLGAAVRKDAIMEAVDKLPPDVLEGLPVSPEMIKNLLEMFVIPDVDTDGDEEPDAASVGVKLGTLAGSVSGECAAE